MSDVARAGYFDNRKNRAISETIRKEERCADRAAGRAGAAAGANPACLVLRGPYSRPPPAHRPSRSAPQDSGSMADAAGPGGGACGRRGTRFYFFQGACPAFFNGGAPLVGLKNIN